MAYQFTKIKDEDNSQFEGINSLEEAEKKFWYEGGQNRELLNQFKDYFFNKISYEEAMKKIIKKEWSEHTGYAYASYLGDLGDYDKYFEIDDLVEHIYADKYEQQLSEYEEKLDEKIASLNENSTIKELVEVYNMIDIYSDLYKDVNHIRPNLSKFYSKADQNASKAAQEYDALNKEEQWKLRCGDSKQVNESIIKFATQCENSLKGAYSIASQLVKQIPQQQATTNEEKELYGNTYVSTFTNICNDIKRYVEFIEDYNKKLASAHIVEEDIIEEFPLKARNDLRNSTNIDETYKALVEELKNRYNSLPDKEKYKKQVLKMKKDLDDFYKSFKK